MHFQIFVPGARGSSPEVLSAVGLGHLAGFSAEYADMQGPGDQSGVMVGWRHETKEFGYDLDRQNWVPSCVDNEKKLARYWVGFWKDNPPTERELIRPYPFRGLRCRLNGGEEWLLTSPGELPHNIRFSDDGSIEYELPRKFNGYAMECADAMDRFVDASKAESNKAYFSDEWALSLVTKSLILNYRTTPEVISYGNGESSLLNSYNLGAAAMIACGIAAKAQEMGHKMELSGLLGVDA